MKKQKTFKGLLFAENPRYGSLLDKCGLDAKLLAVVFFAMAATSAFAGVTYTWKGGSGNWSDSSNWTCSSSSDPGLGYPSRSTDEVSIPVNSAPCTINIDVNVSVTKCGMVKTTATAPAVTFAGTGSVAFSGAFAVNAFRTAIIDGPSISVGATFYVRGTATIESGSVGGQTNVEVADGSTGRLVLNGGEMLLSNKTMTLKSSDAIPGCSFVINGGRLQTSESLTLGKGTTVTVAGDGIVEVGAVDIYGALSIFAGSMTVGNHKLNPGGSFSQSGGRYFITRSAPRGSGSTVSVTGGEFVVVDFGWSDSRYYGDAGSSFSATLNSIYTMEFFKKEYEACAIRGALFVTNSVGMLGGACITNGFTKICGGGRFALGQFLYIPYIPDIPVFIDLSEIDVGCRFEFRAPVVFASGATIKAFGDWVSTGTGIMRWGGSLMCDSSDAFDGVTPRNFSLLKTVPASGASLSVRGPGVVAVEILDNATMLQSVSVEAGAKLIAPNGFSARSLSLASGATMELSSTSRVDVVDADVSQGASISYVMSQEEGVYPVVSCGSAEAAQALTAITSLSGDWAEGATVSALGNSIAAIRGSIGTTYPTNEWIGVVDGSWENAENWTGRASPMANQNAYFGGTNNMHVTLGSNHSPRKMDFLPTSGPFTLSGSKITLSANAYNEGASICSNSRFPVRLESTIIHAGTTFGIVSMGGSYVELAGTAYGGRRVTVSGSVRVSGSLTSGWFALPAAVYNESKATRFTVLDGGSATFTNQCNDLARSASLDVNGGGTLSMIGSNRWTSVANIHSVNGTLTLGGRLSMTADQTFSGTGLVAVAHAYSDVGGSAICHIDGGLRLSPGIWETASEDAPNTVFSIMADTSARLAAATDWTYGPAEGVVAGTAAEARAFRICAGSTLTVDTGDVADPSIGHVGRFADPVIGAADASVVKDGLGTLVFAAEGNSIPGGVEVLKGAIGWTCDVSLPSITFAAGAELSPPLKAGGGFATLSVDGDVDLTGVSFKAFNPEAKAALMAESAEWLAVPAGSHITGTPNSRGWRWRVIDTGSGEVLEVQRVGGFYMAIR